MDQYYNTCFATLQMTLNYSFNLVHYFVPGLPVRIVWDKSIRGISIGTI